MTWNDTSIERTIPLAYGTLLLALALYEAAEFWKLNGLHGSRLVFVLIKDQAFYFILWVVTVTGDWNSHLILSRAISCSVFNILDDKFAESLLSANVLESLGNPTLLCILGSRMFFNLKEAAEHGVNVGTNWSSYSHSAVESMHFEEPQNGEGQ